MEPLNRKETPSGDDVPGTQVGAAEQPPEQGVEGLAPQVERCEAAPQDADQAPPSIWLRARWFAERYTVAHLTAYPVGVLASMAAIPLALMLRGEQVKQAQATGARSSLLAEVAADLQLDPTSAAQMEIVMEFALGCALLTLLVPHITALPWAWAASRRRAPSTPRSKDPVVDQRFRWFVGSMLTLGAAWLLVGAGGWIWLFTL